MRNLQGTDWGENSLGLILHVRDTWLELQFGFWLIVPYMVCKQSWMLMYECNRDKATRRAVLCFLNICRGAHASVCVKTTPCAQKIFHTWS